MQKDRLLALHQLMWFTFDVRATCQINHRVYLFCSVETF